MAILTTPNPSTLANGLRLMDDRSLLWGTEAFLREVKVDGGAVIDRGDIHYREYPAWMVRDLMIELGYRVESVSYYHSGIAPRHPLWKRLAKRLLRLTGLAARRPFAFGYIICARKLL